MSAAGDGRFVVLLGEDTGGAIEGADSLQLSWLTRIAAVLKNRFNTCDSVGLAARKRG
jgi:hypothetical protein